MSKRWFHTAATVLLAFPYVGAHAQDSGLKGFLHRAGSTIGQVAGRALGAPANPAAAQTGGIASATGPYFERIKPATGGEFEGLFERWKQGDAWPRAAVKFTEFGSQLPCWTATATIWHSPSRSHEETFKVCNAPIVTTDDLGNPAQVGGMPLNGIGTQLFLARNVPGISHADTSSTRNTGPNPPALLFGVSLVGESQRIAPLYDQQIVRLAWITGYINHGEGAVNNNSGKLLWVAGFDPAGNRDRH